MYHSIINNKNIYDNANDKGLLHLFIYLFHKIHLVNALELIT